MDRIFSLILATLELVAASLVWGTTPAWILFVALLIPLAGIWFGRPIGERFGLEALSFGQGKITQTESSPTSIMQFIGWSLLAALLAVGVITIKWFWLPLGAVLVIAAFVYARRRRATD